MPKLVQLSFLKQSPGLNYLLKQTIDSPAPINAWRRHRRQRGSLVKTYTPYRSTVRNASAKYSPLEVLYDLAILRTTRYAASRTASKCNSIKRAKTPPLQDTRGLWSLIK